LLINKHKTLAKNHRIDKNSEHKSKHNRSQATLNRLLIGFAAVAFDFAVVAGCSEDFAVDFVMICCLCCMVEL